MGKNDRTIKHQFQLRDKIKLPQQQPDIALETAAKAMAKNIVTCPKCEQALKTREFAQKRKGVRLKPEILPTNLKDGGNGDLMVSIHDNSLQGIFKGYTKSGKLKIQSLDNDGKKRIRTYAPNSWVKKEVMI